MTFRPGKSDRAALSSPPSWPPRAGKYFGAMCIDLKTPELFRVDSVADLLTILDATATGTCYGYDKRGVCRLKLKRWTPDEIRIERWGPRGGRAPLQERYHRFPREELAVAIEAELLSLVWLGTKLHHRTPALVQLAVTALMKPV